MAQEFKKCPSCGARNDPSNLSCQMCGLLLGNVASTPLPVLASRPQTTNQPLNPPMLRMKRTKSGVIWWPLVLIFVVFLIVFVSFVVKKNPTPLPITPQLPQGLGTITLADGEVLGVNDGSYAPFDIGRNAQEIAFKRQAVSLLKTDRQGAIALWQDALKIESNDAEALIYLEDQRVFTSGKPHITLIAGTAFTPPFPDTASENILQGVYVAQHQYNELHRNGTQLLLLIANSGGATNDANTTRVAQQIVQIARRDSTVVGVIGWSGSASTLQALSNLSQAKIPLISPKASSDELSGSSSYFFRIVPPNLQQAQIDATFAEETLHVKNPVVFLDNTNSFSVNLAGDFEQQFKDVNRHLHEELFVTGNTTKAQFSHLIQDAVQHQADAFYFTSASSVDTGLFQDALPVSSPPVVAGDGSYVAHANSHGRWYFTTFAYHSESATPIATQFAQDYSTDFNPYGQEPAGYYGYSLADDHTILSYDATAVVLAAIEMAYAHGKTTVTAQDLADTLPQISGANAFQGVSGQISFGPNHDPINKAIVILSVSKQGHIEMKNGINGCFMKGRC